MSGQERVEQYLAEAQAHSQGKFSWDGLRMAELLALYIEADPADMSLHCLASAVAGGATFLKVTFRGARIIVCWDGTVDLENLGPQGDSALALALHCAARQGKVVLATPSGRLSYSPGEGWRRNRQGSQHNRLELCQRAWWRAFKTSPQLARLRARGGYAPLECQPGLRAAPKPVAWCVSWGQLPVPVCLPEQQVNLPCSLHGSGCAFPGTGKWQMVVKGVAYPISDGWPELDLVWWGEFPLDLNRTRLVRGLELGQWLSWLTVELGRITAERHWPGVPLELLLQVGGDEIWNAGWYRRADGHIASLGNMQDYYDRWGCLPVVGAIQQQAGFLFEQGLPEQIQELFPNWLYLPSEYGRLPEHEDYLVRVPLSSGQGEIGLRANPGLGQRVWTGQGWRALDRKPHGIDLTLDSPPNYIEQLVLLYTCLLEQDCPRPAWASFHVACFLDYLHFARHIRDYSEIVTFPHPCPSIRQLSLAELVKRYPVPMLSGGSRTLTEIEEHAQAYVNPNSAHGYVSEYLTFYLLGRGSQENQGLSSTRCHRLLAGQQGTLLERLRADSGCAAAQMLARLPGCRPRPQVDLDQARRELGTGSNILCTPHLLLAMTDELDHLALVEILPDFLELENEQDLAAMEAVCAGELRLTWLWGKFQSRLRSQQFDSAQQLAQEARHLFPRHWLSAFMAGLSGGFGGDLEAACSHLEESLRRGGPMALLQPYFWHSALLSRGGLAHRILMEPAESMPMQLLVASQQPDPTVRVRTVQAMLEHPHCPASAYEILGKALAELGDFTAACVCFRRFLAARHDQVMEFDLPARHERARAWLEEQAGPA
ncbi:MAG: hypothetical protein U0931_36910 [Vulcanimicrobiota bacterium]